MSALSDIERLAAEHHLHVAGVAPVEPGDGLRPDLRSVVLLGPDEPAFWPRFTATPEYLDGAPDALDRWSLRVIGRMACDLGAKALFPFGGPPYHPFITWALRSGRVWSSPVRFLVHDRAGLFISFRGAIALREAIVTTAAARPCDSCADQPCATACPVGALTPAGYDLDTCHDWLDRAEGQDCLTKGCAVRRACPVGAGRRLPEQSAHHMRYFHPR